MRRRINDALNREVTLPRWAMALDFFYRAFLVIGACTVIYLWYQAATRDEEADRNARIQACTTEYASTGAAHDADVVAIDQEADRLFAEIVQQAGTSLPIDRDTLTEYRAARAEAAEAALNVEEMARRRIGLAQYAAESVQAGNAFECPALPAHLRIVPLEPR